MAKAAHPFSTKKYFGRTQYILVHNGVVRNAKELQKVHAEKYKIKYQSMLENKTFNDSEALLWEFALHNEGKKDEMEASGSIAFVCLKLEDGELSRLHFGRNSGSPLKMYRDKNGIALSSEGQGDSIDMNKLYSWNYAKKRLTDKQYTITGYVYTGNYSSGPYTPPKPAPLGGGFVGDSYTDSNYDPYDDGYDPTCGSCKTLAYACCDHDTWEGYTNWGNYQSSTPTLKATPTLGERMKERFGISSEEELSERIEAAIKEREVKKPENTAIEVPKVPLSRKTAENILLLRKDMQPTDNEIETEYMAYLATFKGVFEQAYWKVEDDYEDAENEPDTLASIRKRVVLEKVLERFQNDPEYQGDGRAVSSLWRSIWLQQDL